MNLQVYRTVSGLGGVPTGALLRSRVAWVESDSTYCLRVAGVCEAAVIRYEVSWSGTAATLTAVTTSGSETGDPVTLAVAETAHVWAGDCWVELERVAAGFVGEMVFRPVPGQNNEIGMGDASDPSTLTTYRCVYLYAGAGLTVDSIAGDGVSVGVDAVGDGAAVLADEDTAPGGISFAASWSDGQALSAGEWLPVWLRRVASADAGEHENTVTITYTEDGETYTVVLVGVYVTYLTARTPYYLYYQVAASGYAAQVDTVDAITVETPVAVAALPYAFDVGAIQTAMHGLGYDDIVVSMALRAARDSGAESQNQRFDNVLSLNYTTGDETTPNAPTIDTFEFLDGGQVRLVVDHDQAGGLSRATRLYATCGSETLRVTLPIDEDVTESEFVFATATSWGASVSVAVYAQDVDGRQSASATDTADALWDYGADHGGDVFPGARTLGDVETDGLSSASWGDVTAAVAAGYAVIQLDGVTVLDGRTDPFERCGVRGLAFKGADVSGVGVAAPVEPVSATEFYLCAGGVRVAKVDTAAGRLYCWKFTAGEPEQACPVADVWGEYDGVVYWQVYDPVTLVWRPWLCVDSNENKLVFCMAIKAV